LIRLGLCMCSLVCTSRVCCSVFHVIDDDSYDLAFTLSMVPIASAGMNLMRPWPGASVCFCLSVSVLVSVCCMWFRLRVMLQPALT
jgi:hypothetical protein